MAVNLNAVFDAVSKNSTPEGNEDSVRSIAASALASGVPVGVGTSLITGETQKQTTRVFSGSDQQAGSNQGDRQQVLPATDNKLPRIYGEITTGGVCVDVHKESANTIYACFVLSDMDTTGFDQHSEFATPRDLMQITGVYRNNDQAIGNQSSYPFTPTNGDTTVKVLADIDDANTNVNIATANVLNVWAWAGNSSSTSLIYPNLGGTYTGQNAYDVFPTWDANVTMANCCFAIVKVDRLNEDIDPSAPTEIEDVGEWRFRVKTEGLDREFETPSVLKLLTNPSHALEDYLTNDVYGCGLTEADLDLTAFESWADYCDENIIFVSRDTFPEDQQGASGSIIPLPDGTSGYSWLTNRYETHGFLNTQAPVIENIDKICQAGSAILSYDTKQGKFTVLVNREATSAEKTNAFQFNSNNIISSITVNSTDLYSLYNFNEVTFPNYRQQDRADNVFVDIPVADRVSNEPTSGTNYNIDAVNQSYRVSDLANISLKSSRVNTTISFTGDHSTMGVAVGDYAKVTDATKGFEEKIVKVMRVNEREQSDGTLIFDYVTLEYSDAPYEEMIYLDSVDEPLGGAVGTRYNYNKFSGNLDVTNFFESWNIPFGSVVGSQNVETGNIYVINETDTGNGNVYNYLGNLVLANDSASGIRGQVQIPTSPAIYFVGLDSDDPILAIKGSANVDQYGSATSDWSGQNITLTNQNPDTAGAPPLNSITLNYPINIIAADSTNYCWFPLNKLTSGTYTISLEYETDIYYPKKKSQIAVTGNITISDLDCDTPNLITLANVEYGKGTQLKDGFTEVPAGDQTLLAGIFPRQFDICNIAQASFTVTSNLRVAYTAVASTSYIQLSPLANITFESKTTQNSETFEIGLAGLDLLDNTAGDTGTIANADIQGKYIEYVTSAISTKPEDYGLTQDFYPARLRTDILTKHKDFTNLSMNGSLEFKHIPHNYRYKT